MEVLQSKLMNNVKQIWENTTAAVKAVGFEKREVSKVREKWKNIHSTAKKELLIRCH